MMQFLHIKHSEICEAKTEFLSFTLENFLSK